MADWNRSGLPLVMSHAHWYEVFDKNEQREEMKQLISRSDSVDFNVQNVEKYAKLYEIFG